MGLIAALSMMKPYECIMTLSKMTLEILTLNNNTHPLVLSILKQHDDTQHNNTHPNSTTQHNETG